MAAGVIDFASSSGQVTLNAEGDVNLQLTAGHFDGTLSAWAERAVRVLAPPGFGMPFSAVVNRRDAFVCRTAFAAEVKHIRQGELHIFKRGVDDDAVPAIYLRSEHATVVIDEMPADISPPH